MCSQYYIHLPRILTWWEFKGNLLSEKLENVWPIAYHLAFNSVLIMLLGKSITLINIKFEIIQLNFNNVKLNSKILAVKAGYFMDLPGAQGIYVSLSDYACACVTAICHDEQTIGVPPLFTPNKVCIKWLFSQKKWNIDLSRSFT